MAAADAEAWARQGEVPGRFKLLYESQQRTPAGRGLPLAEVSAPWLPLRLLGQTAQPGAYRLQAFRPLVIKWNDWRKLQTRISAEARGLGLDLGTDLVVEWWLDRQGHDGVVFEDAKRKYGHPRVAIAFRRRRSHARRGWRIEDRGWRRRSDRHTCARFSRMAATERPPYKSGSWFCGSAVLRFCGSVFCGSTPA